MPTAAPPTTHQFKGFDDWIEVFRAGTHTDSKGKTVSFTAADLDEMVANNAALGAAPAVIGHPKHNDPAYAWGREVRREGDSLFAKFTDINPAFAAGVASGAYRNRSLSVYKDPVHGWRIRHHGWLGAAPPAIDGLQPLDYAAGELPDQHDFALDPWSVASAIDDMAAIARAWRERLIVSEGLEAADAAMPEWRISSLTANAARIREAESTGSTATRLFTQQSDPGASDMPFTQADLDRTAQETEARIRAELGSQFTAQTTALQELQAERRQERIATQIAGWRAAGQLLPAEEVGLAEFMAALEGGTAEAFEFTAAGASAPAKKTPTEFFAEFVARRGQLVKLTGAPKAGTETDPGASQVDMSDARAIANAATEFQAAEAKAGRVITIDQAVAHITRNV